MKISLNWIKDFVDLDHVPADKDLVDMITLSVCEIEGFEKTGEHLKQTYVALVEEIEPHPNAEKLSLVCVDYGIGKSRVVCGASNFKVGDKVPFVGEGTTLPGDFTIKKAEIRGIESAGMLCAEDELGFSDDHAGLMILDSDLKVGTPLNTIFADHVDLIMEVDNKTITHRPDLWGHYGFARELSTILKRPVKPIQENSQLFEGEGDNIVNIEVLAGELVPRFAGISVDNISVSQSPDWLRHRLTRVGLRPINNMVDLTNYIMLELGQPMHAFDANQIPGNKLTVKLADEGTKLMTLYKKEVTLNQNDMVIYDAEGPSSVAGVIGGLRSGVADHTTAVFLEAANWNPVSIRKTSTKIGLRTDASQRFEKALDPEICYLAVQRGLELLKMTNPDMRVRGELIDIVNKRYDEIKIPINAAYISRMLGADVSTERVTEILTYLGFVVDQNGDELLVDVPSYRRTKDISIPEDLVEEIGRVYGYNNITPIAPKFPVEPPAFNQELQFTKMTRDTLCHNGFFEIYNYPLTCQKTEDVFGLSSQGVMKLINPVADHQNQMRTSMLPHLVETVIENQKRDAEFKIFEIGRTYVKDTTGTIQEPRNLVMAVSNKRGTSGKAFYELKRNIVRLMSALQIPEAGWEKLEETECEFYQHKNIAAKLLSGETLLGQVFNLAPAFVDQQGIKEDVCLAVLDFGTMLSMEKTEYIFSPKPKYPSVFFELSIVVPARVEYAIIEKIISSVSELIVSVNYLGIYQLKDQTDKKSMSISIAFQALDRTMKSEEVTVLQEEIIKSLADAGFKLREG